MFFSYSPVLLFDLGSADGGTVATGLIYYPFSHTSSLEKRRRPATPKLELKLTKRRRVIA